MGEYQVHRVRFFDYKPNAINCLAYGKKAKKLALSRSDATIEIWSVKDVASDWHQEQILPPSEGNSIESLVWSGDRLFSSGLHGNVLEHNLSSLVVKNTVSANSGAIWCMDINDSETTIATGTEEGCVVLFTVTPYGLEYHKSLHKQEGRLLSIAWCEAENVIVTGGIDNIRVWSINSGHAIQRLSPGRVDRAKPTVVWTLAIASDFTIVSGDSRGKVCFWNGRQGTQISSIQSHRADVLSLCVSSGGNTVVAAGVDPTIVQFEYTPVSVKSEWKRWVRTTIWHQHTHDIRSVIFVQDSAVVSGGIDCQITISRVQLEHSHKSRLFKRLAPIPHESVVCVARDKNLVLLKYPEKLEVWRLGHTHVHHTDNNGELLPLSRKQTKLVELRSKESEYIVSCAISTDGQWIVYSDKHKPKLYQLSFDEDDQSDISLKRVRYMPVEVQATSCMCFTPDNSKLLLVTPGGDVQVIQLDPEAVQPTVCHTFKSPTAACDCVHLLTVSGCGKYVATADCVHLLTVSGCGKYVAAADCVHLLTVSGCGKYVATADCVHLLTVSGCGKYVATADTKSNVHVYDLELLKPVCSLPRGESTPTAMAFHPTQPLIVLVCADRKVYEYDLIASEYTDWSRLFSEKCHRGWLSMNATDKCKQIQYSPTAPHKLLLRDEERIYVIDKSQPFPPQNSQIFTSRNQSGKKHSQDSGCFHVCHKYKFLMHLDVLTNGQLVIVERPPGSITDELPPTLKLKKFGS